MEQAQAIAPQAMVPVAPAPPDVPAPPPGGVAAPRDGQPPGSVIPTEAAAPSFVYATGRVEPRFPSLALEKEFAQVTGRTETAGLTDRQALQAVLAARPNRYLARHLCWVLTVEGLETYLLAPGDPADLDLLIETVRPTPSWSPTGGAVGRTARSAR